MSIWIVLLFLITPPLGGWLVAKVTKSELANKGKSPWPLVVLLVPSTFFILLGPLLFMTKLSSDQPFAYMAAGFYTVFAYFVGFLVVFF